MTAPDSRPSDLRVRAIAGVVMIAVALGALTAGGVLFWLLAAAAGVVMAGEWAGLFAVTGRQRRMVQFAVSVPLAIMAPVAAGPNFFVLGLIAAAFFFIVIVTRRPGLAAGSVYVAVPIFALLLIREQANGLIFTLWALALVWACDIGAYFTGRAIGGPKLAPAISPAKTWSGLGGGVVLAGLFGAAMHLGYGLPWRLTLATPALAVVAQGGDLFESWMKRRAGVKDSGTILPGHGGLLDRLDGVVPVAPLAALLVLLPRLMA